jgi:glucosamine 6-phosphate synthetase-like amidotransferase/phosphosugar isomerase protein/UDP-3-O-[3-hydroxymyristoyl] glucosamine N-acyltransferase
MRRKRRIVKLISLGVLLTFLFTNTAQAAPYTEAISSLATQPGGRDLIPGGDLSQAEIEQAAVRAYVRRRMAILRSQNVTGADLAARLRTDGLAWAQQNGLATIDAATIVLLLNGDATAGVQGILAEVMEFVPTTVAEVTPTAELTESPEVPLGIGVLMPIAERITAPPITTVSTLRITGITYADAEGRVISRTFSDADGQPVAVHVGELSVENAQALVQWHQAREAGTLEEMPGNQEMIGQQLDLLQPYLDRDPVDLMNGLQQHETASFCLAALEIKGAVAFCATRGDVIVARRLQLGYGRDPIGHNDVEPFTEIAKAANLEGIIASQKPVYVIEDIAEVSGQYFAEFVVYTNGIAGETQRRQIPGPLEGTAQAFLQAKQQLKVAREDFVRETDEKEKKKKGKLASQRDQELKAVKTANFREIGAQIFAEETTGDAAEFRVYFLEGYMSNAADLHDNVEGYFRTAWKIKERFENFSRVYGDTGEQGALGRFADFCLRQADREEEIFRQLEQHTKEAGSRIRWDELEIYRLRLQKLRDLGWTLKKDTLENVEKIQELADGLGVDVSAPAAEAAAADVAKREEALEELMSLNAVLRSIDQRLETRGRDSLGVISSFTFTNQEDYVAFLEALGPDGRAAFEARQKIPDLVNKSIVVRHTYKLVDGERAVDPEGPVTVTFVYKTAELIGRLGDNTRRIKESMFGDDVLKTLIQRGTGTGVSVKLAHTRWASAGIVSEENCHTVDNVGVYTEEMTGGSQVESVWDIQATGANGEQQLYPGYTRMGRIFCVLNGDIANYKSETITGLKVFPDLTDEYGRTYAEYKVQTDSGEFESRSLSEDITTDAKLIPLRIEYYLVTTGCDLEEAIRLACNDFAGSFAIQVYSDLEPGKTFCAVGGKGQGLYVGLSERGYHPASELHGFTEETQAYVQVESGTVVTVDRSKPPTPGNLKVTKFDGAVSSFTDDSLKRTDLTSRDIHLDTEHHEHFLDQEITQAGQMWRDTIAGRADIRDEVPFINLGEEEIPQTYLDMCASGEVDEVWVTGMGTAESASHAIGEVFSGYAEMISRAGGHALKVRAGTPTEFAARVKAGEDLSRVLVIGVSQSGGTTDTNTFLNKAFDQGAKLLGIINKRDSDGVHIIKGGGGGVLYTGTGRDIEIAVASTKAYYAQIAAGSLYAMRIAQAMSKAVRPLPAYLGRLGMAELEQENVNTRMRLLEFLDQKSYAHGYSVDGVLRLLFVAVYGEQADAKEAQFNAFRAEMQDRVRLAQEGTPVQGKAAVEFRNAGEALHAFFAEHDDLDRLKQWLEGDMEPAILEQLVRISEGERIDLSREIAADVEELHRIPDEMDKWLREVNARKPVDGKGGHPVYQVAQNWPLRRANWAVLGWGSTIPGAREVTIKLSEECYITIPWQETPNAKHVDFSAHAWRLICAANAHGAGDLIYKNLDGEVAKLGAHDNPVTIITHEGDNRFDAYTQQVRDRDGNLVTVPVEVIKVPRCREKFASVFNAMAGHKLAYETAKAMDEHRANRVATATQIITDKQAERTAEIRAEVDSGIPGQDVDRETALELLKDRDYLQTVAQALYPMMNAIQDSIFNNEFTAADSNLMTLYYCAFVTALRHGEAHRWSDFPLPENADKDPVEFLRMFEQRLKTWHAKLMRTIDAIRDQAKFVTVGTEAEGVSLAEAMDLFKLITGKLEHYEESQVLMGYNAFKMAAAQADGSKPMQVGICPFVHATTKTGEDIRGKVPQATSITIVAEDKARVMEKASHLLGARQWNILATQHIPYTPEGEGAQPVAILRFVINKSIDEVTEGVDIQDVSRALEAELNAPAAATYALRQEVRDELGRLGFSEPTMADITRHAMRFEDDRVIYRQSFIHLLAEQRGVRPGDVTRELLYHERVHNLIRLDRGISRPQLLTDIRGALTPEFVSRFAEEFGFTGTAEALLQDDEFVEEVLVQYYSELFENRRSGLFNEVASDIEAAVTTSHTSLQLVRIGDFADDASSDDVRRDQIAKLLEVTGRAQALGAQSRIDLERGDSAIEWEVTVARARARPSGFVSRRPDTPFMNSPRARELSRMKLEQLRAQGVTVVGDEDSIFIGRFVDISNWTSGQIHAGTVITGRSLIGNGVVLGVGSTVHDSFLGEGVQVLNGSEAVNALVEQGAVLGMCVDLHGNVLDEGGAVVRNAIVRQDARIANAVVETRDFNPEKPAEWAYDSHHRVREHQTEIARNCLIFGQAHIQNTTVDEHTRIEGGSYLACEIGEYNDLRRLKAVWLHTEFDVIVIPKYPNGLPAIAEMQDRWIGFGYRHFGAEIYGEGLADNIVAGPDAEGKETVVHYVPQGSPEGNRVVYSSFNGTGETPVTTTADRFVGNSQHPVMKRSAHGFFRLHPLAWLGGRLQAEAPVRGDRINIVGQYQNPAVTDYANPYVTDLLPGSVLGPNRWVDAWGPLLGRVYGQRWQTQDHTFFLDEAPNFFAGGILHALMYVAQNEDNIRRALAKRRQSLIDQGIPAEELGYLEYRNMDDIVPTILRARIAMVDQLLEQGEEAGVKGSVVSALKAAREVYQMHLTNPLAQELWKVEGGHLKHWSYNAEGGVVLDNAEPYAEAGLIANPTDWPVPQEYYEPYEDPASHDRYRPKSLTDSAMAATAVSEDSIGTIPAKFRNLRHVVIDPTASIDEDVVIEEGTAERPTVIGAGVVLRKKTMVGAGARLYRTRAQNTTFGANGIFNFVDAIADRGSRITFEADVEYNYTTLAARNRHNITLGSGSKGEHAVLMAFRRNTSIGEGTELFCHASVHNSIVGARCRIGCKVKNSHLGTGVSAQHAATRLYGVRAPDGTTANASNIGAGAILGHPDADFEEPKTRVFLAGGCFIGTNKKIAGGTAIGELAFIVDHISKPVQIPDLTFYQRGTGMHGGVLDHIRLGLPYIARFGIGYAERYAATPEQREATNYRMERLIVQLVDDLFSEATKLCHPTRVRALEPMWQALRKATHFVRDDLKGELDHLTRDQRIRQRNKLFAEADRQITTCLEDSQETHEFNQNLARLGQALENLGDGRYRMRDGRLTDVVWYNDSNEDGRPDFEILQLTDALVQKRLERAQRPTPDSAFRDSGDTNLGTFQTTLRELKTDRSTAQYGLATSARFIMDNIGAQEALRDLIRQQTSDRQQAFVLAVSAENEAERRVIEALDLPCVTDIVQLPEGASDEQRVAALVGRLEAHNIARDHIGMIENPTEAADIQQRLAQLQAFAPDIYIGVPHAPAPGQLLSVYGAFREVIEAIATQREERVFSFNLPIERPNAALHEAFEEYREAIEFLKHA